MKRSVWEYRNSPACRCSSSWSFLSRARSLSRNTSSWSPHLPIFDVCFWRPKRSGHRARGNAEAQPWPSLISSKNISFPRTAGRPRRAELGRATGTGIAARAGPSSPRRQRKPCRCLVPPPEGCRGGRAQARRTARGPWAASEASAGTGDPAAAPSSSSEKAAPAWTAPPTAQPPLSRPAAARSWTPLSPPKALTHPLVEDWLHVYCQRQQPPPHVTSPANQTFPSSPTRCSQSSQSPCWARPPERVRREGWQSWRRPLPVRRPPGWGAGTSRPRPAALRGAGRAGGRQTKGYCLLSSRGRREF